MELLIYMQWVLRMLPVFMNVYGLSSESIFFRTELPRLEFQGATLNFKVVDNIGNFGLKPIGR